MEAPPLLFDLHMNEDAADFQDVDVDEMPDPFTKFIESRAFEVAGASAGVAALQKLAPAKLRTEDPSNGNPWVAFSTVNSKPIESPFEPPDDGVLAKGATSPREIAMREYLKKARARGEDLEAMAQAAIDGENQQLAELIRRIARTL